jgi:hypothetical protein
MIYGTVNQRHYPQYVADKAKHFENENSAFKFIFMFFQHFLSFPFLMIFMLNEPVSDYNSNVNQTIIEKLLTLEIWVGEQSKGLLSESANI